MIGTGVAVGSGVIVGVGEGWPKGSRTSTPGITSTFGTETVITAASMRAGVEVGTRSPAKPLRPVVWTLRKGTTTVVTALSVFAAVFVSWVGLTSPSALVAVGVGTKIAFSPWLADWLAAAGALADDCRTGSSAAATALTPLACGAAGAANASGCVVAETSVSGSVGQVHQSTKMIALNMPTRAVVGSAAADW